MSKVLVAQSTVKDGSMANRHDPLDPLVKSNRQMWLFSLGIDSAHTYRIGVTFEDNGNYCRYREVVDGDAAVNEYDIDNREADAFVTTKVGEALFLPIADCIGAVLFDEEKGVLMVSHLGRHSLEQQGAARSVEHLVRQYGSNPKKLKVWLSAAIGKELYSIYAMQGKGLKEVAYEQFIEAGIALEHIEDNTADTGTSPDYYSHSQFLKGIEEKNGRHAIVAMMTNK